jgi:hypothetical protein
MAVSVADDNGRGLSEVQGDILCGGGWFALRSTLSTWKCYLHTELSVFSSENGVMYPYPVNAIYISVLTDFSESTDHRLAAKP